MKYAPIARIVVRYVVGGTLGIEASAAIAGDPDIIAFVAVAIGAGVEAKYVYAKKRGWTT